MRSVLAIETGPTKGQHLVLTEGKAVGIGRDSRCAICLPDQMVSRLHCSLRFAAGRWRVVDQQSSNGTFVNDQLVTERLLTPGDTIQVGETLLSFASEEDDPFLGATVGGHRIERRLGRGAVGTVYLAQQLSIDRPVAFKILAPHLAGDANFVSSFLEEAKAAGRLNHPNVVQVYDAGRGGHSVYISMEYLEGGSVEDLLLKETRLAPAVAVPMAIDAAEALSFAERQQIVHRDIKPGNLLISSDGKVKIGDLGIAADLRRPGAAMGGRVVGSPRYMAPEQARGEKVDHRADIYALGATLYKMLCGESPYEGNTIKEIIVAKLERDPPPLRQKAPEVPAPLASVVHGMLARDPARRYSSAHEVEEALSRAMRIQAPVRRQRPVRIVARRSKSPMGVLAGIGVAAIALIVFLVVLKNAGPGAARKEEGPIAGAGGSSARLEGDGSEARSPGEASAGSEVFGLKEVGKVFLDWRERRITAEEAEARLTDISRSYPQAAVKAQTESTRRDIRKGAAERGKELSAAVAELGGRLKKRIEEGDLRGAGAILAQFEKEHPEGRTSAERKMLDDAVSALVAKCKSEIEPLLKEERFDEALKNVSALEAKVPPEKQEEVAALRRTVEIKESRLRDREAALQAAAGPVRSAIAALDFGAASKLLEESGGAASARPSFLSEELTLTREAWTKIQGALAPGKSLRLRFRPGPLEKQPAGQYRVESLKGAALRVQPSGKKSFVTLPVSALETENLLELLGSTGEEKAPQKVEVSTASRRGLGLLLLLRCGPERAKELLGPDSQPGSVLQAAADTWLRVRLDEAEKLSQECAASKAPDDAWNYIACCAAELILGWKGRKDYDSVQPRLRKLYLDARQAALSLLPPEDMFHAKTVKFEKGLVKLTYDFSTEEQAKDFQAVGDAVKNPVRWVKGRKVLTLVGEARFLRGNPFGGRLAVRGTAAFADAAPNVNLAFWTDEKDVLTIGLDGRALDLRRWRDAQGTEPADYFLFGMGYRLPFEVVERGAGSKDFGRILEGLRGFLPIYLRETSLVILAGTHGGTLHRDRRELIWEASLGNQMKGTARFAIEMAADGTVQWSLNGRPVPFGDSIRLGRLKENAPHEGSITFLAYGGEVHYAGLEISGELRPEWIKSQVSARAEEELASLEGKKNAGEK